MQINIHSAQNNTQTRYLNSKKTSRQGSEIKMTLKEYLESVNLKRRISSRSKQKKKPAANDPNANLISKQINYLQPPINSNPTVQFYKLNQEWKAINQFSSWIRELKQLCRDFIKKDEEYVEVVRLIEKISQFVKSEVETIKRDHLLLQSFLVTEASYWGEGEIGNGGEGNMTANNPNFDRFSNYMKAVLSTNSQYSNELRSKFTNEKQKIEENFEKNRNPHVPQSPQQSNNKHIDREQQSIPTNHKVCYKTSTEPKTHPSSYVKNAEESDGFRRTSLSSGKVIMQGETGGEKGEGSREYKIGSIKNGKNEDSWRQKQNHYIYSFNDKNAYKTHNHNNFPQSNSHNNLQINPFQQSTNKIQQQSCSEQLGLLKIQSRNQDQVPRLSLMSRFDQHKQQVVNKEINNCMRKEKNQKISDSTTLNDYLKRIEHNKGNYYIIHQEQPKQSPFQHHQSQSTYHQSQQIHTQSSQKPPLRQRRHKTQKLTQQYDNFDENQFQMIKLDEGNVKLQNGIQQGSLTNQSVITCGQKSICRSKESSIKVQIKSRLQNKKQIQGSPSMVRQSPHVISIQTPSTLRRRYSGNNNNNQTSLVKKNNEEICINIREAQSHQKANDSTRMPHDNGKRVESRGNIMTRYENFRKAY